jgi:hypothetical protein
MGRIVPLQCPEGPRLTHLQDFSDRFMALDFSHLSQTGRVAHRPSARSEAVSSRLHTPLCDVGHQARSKALRKGPLREFSGPISQASVSSLSFWHCVPFSANLVRMREQAISACEGCAEFLRVGAGDQHVKSLTGIQGT